MPEIKDELDGPLSREQIDAVFDAFGSLASREFDLSTLRGLPPADTRQAALDWPQVLRLLFEASAIGNVQSGAGGVSYYTFRFRNRHSTLDQNRRMVLHRSLVRAFNLAHG